MDETLRAKRDALKALLGGLDGVAVAFSGGVDSTLLLKVAHDTLQGRAVAVTARSFVCPDREAALAEAFCADNGIAQVFFDPDLLGVAGFARNGPDRCYECKKAILSMAIEAAARMGVGTVAEGSHMGDLGDFRAGARAVREMGVISPLMSAGLDKGDIRALSRELGLAGWDRQSMSCLANRVPTGEPIVPETLRMADEAERSLQDLGLKVVRVRVHGRLARIETDEAGMATLSGDGVGRGVDEALRGMGFTHVAVDLGGYRTGSMNEYAFRPALRGEIPEIVELYRSLFGTPGCTWGPDYPSAETAGHDVDNGWLYTLKRQGRIVAVASFGDFGEHGELTDWKPKRACELARIGVDRAYQGRGVGTVILQHAIAEVRRQGFDGLRFIVSKGNPAALAMYDKNGFERCGEATVFGVEWYCYQMAF
ncbi:MAG: ATP-dependent sacrificial sulfur transferase LarE [Oscillospiraceae bacterium]|nr:ATP-dependent sacrificial sulfur transferase LarE [Oscillospiraceae bacterium]